MRNSSGFDITVLKTEHSATVSEGHVIWQSPPGNTEIAQGGKVEVVVSKGPEKKPDKLIVRTVIIEYIPAVVEPNPNEEEGDEGEGNNSDGDRTACSTNNSYLHSGQK